MSSVSSSSSGRSRASRVVPAALLFSAAAVVVVSAACGNSGDGPGLVNNQGMTGTNGTGGTKDSGVVDSAIPDSAALPGAEAGIDAGIGCSDGMKDNLETDVDCGGTVCAPCMDGKACIEISDCVGKGCTNKTCDTPTCSDKILNEDETDIDCGGSVCPHCTVGRKCAQASDCSSAACTAGACACPSDMVIVPQAELLGGAYCIDVTEVTKGKYNAFLSSNYPTENQVAGCTVVGTTGNTTYTPRGDWPPADTTAAEGYGVRYVDWCDAYAYCQHAGRELCGNIGGGKLPDGLAPLTLNRAVTGGAEAGTVALDAWYNACSIQGVNTYPYDKSTYTAGLCNDGTTSTESTIPPETAPTAQPWDDLDPGGNLDHSGCNGGAVGLFQMSGNLAEWENACSATSGATDNCAVRGGAWDSPMADLQCDWQTDETRPRLPTTDAVLADIGFRCCEY